MNIFYGNITIIINGNQHGNSNILQMLINSTNTNNIMKILKNTNFNGNRKSTKKVEKKKKPTQLAIKMSQAKTDKSKIKKEKNNKKNKTEETSEDNDDSSVADLTSNLEKLPNNFYSNLPKLDKCKIAGTSHCRHHECISRGVARIPPGGLFKTAQMKVSTSSLSADQVYSKTGVSGLMTVD